MKCAVCSHSRCYTNGQNCTRNNAEQVVEHYTSDDENLKIMESAACTEGKFYNNITRLEESVEFAKAMGYKKIGLAFCIGLKPESKFINEYFSKFFEVESVCCKICGVAKDNMHLEQIKPGTRETMCNPVIQAKSLNDSGCEMNFTIGLCVGHDALFNKASAVPTSCLVAKDRVLAHNPLGAIYSRYWKRKLGILPSDEV